MIRNRRLAAYQLALRSVSQISMFSRSISLRLTPPLLLTLAILGGARPLYAASKKAPPIKPATQYAAFDTHANEHVSIAAEPCTDEKDCPFFRLPYVRHSFIPVRVMITNDSEKALSLDEVRIQFIDANKDVLPAATDEDLERRLFTFRSATGRKIPLPAPLPSITTHGTPIDKKITQDDADFGFPGTTVNAHATMGGYLFYDVRDVDEPALKHAELYVKMIKTMDGKQQLFAFTIPFDTWLAAQPGKSAGSTAKTSANEAKPLH